MKKLVPGDAIILDGKRHNIVSVTPGLAHPLRLDNGCGGGPHAIWSCSDEARLTELGAVRVKRSEQLRHLMGELVQLRERVAELHDHFDIPEQDGSWREVMREITRLDAQS